MSLRTGMNAPAVLIDKYINSAYDTVKLVADNIGTIIDISALVGAYLVAATAPTTRADGSALREGDRWYNSNNDVTYAWDGDAWKSIGTNTTIVENQVVSTPKTVFTLTNPYAPNTNNLLVHIDGVFQLSKSVSNTYGAYTETSASVVTFDSTLPVGTLVTFIIGDVITDSTTALSIQKAVYTAVTDISAYTPITIPGQTYVPDSRTLKVCINGVEQELGEAYSEINTSQVTFTEALTTGDKVMFTITTIS